MPSPEETTSPVRAVRNKPVIPIYDLSVLWFSNTFVWRCPTRTLLACYNRHVTTRHLDVGVGSGYYLDKCRFPTATPSIALLDINATNLQRTARRLARYQPRCYQGNALEPWLLDERVDSVAINYLLHCLPGPLTAKAVVFEHLKPWLNPGGLVFGATILGRGVAHGPLAPFFLRTYNTGGIFGNADDDPQTLQCLLQAHFREVTFKIVGSVALFSGRV